MVLVSMAPYSLRYDFSFHLDLPFFFIVMSFITFFSVIRRPAVRKYFNLPDLQAQSASAKKQMFNLFGGSKALPAAESPVAITGGPGSSLEQSDAAALGYRAKNLKNVKSRGKSWRRR